MSQRLTSGLGASLVIVYLECYILALLPFMFSVIQVNNACATGSSALLLAKQLVEGNMCDCVLALGFEKMEKGSLRAKVLTQSAAHI